MYLFSQPRRNFALIPMGCFCVALVTACGHETPDVAGPGAGARIGVRAAPVVSVQSAALLAHHSVTYLGTATANGVSTARWAVTEHGCGSAALVPRLASSMTGASTAAARKGTGCNSMSHIAFEDFVGSSPRLLLQSGPYIDGTIFSTITDSPPCLTGAFTCLSTVYGQFYGASRPDGPGNWIKFSTVNGETVALAAGKTHVFAILFSCTYTEGTTVVAIKSGNVVVKGSVPAPRCS